MPVRTPLRTITNLAGTVFAVRLVPIGAANTLGGEVTGSALLEFFNTDSADDSGGNGKPDSGKGGEGFGPLGQYLGDLSLSALLYGIDTGDGLPRLGGIIGWEVDTVAAVAIVQWLADAEPETLAASRAYMEDRRRQAHLRRQAVAAARLPRVFAELGMIREKP